MKNELVSERALGIVAAFVLLLAGPLLAQEQATGKPPLLLTLKDCISRALANNLDVSIEAMNPEIDEASISLSKELYLPQFSLSYFKRDQNQPGTWGVEGTSYFMKSDQYSLSLSQRVVTGASITFSFANSMTNTSRAFTVINPSYSSLFQLDVIQPLLKDFGPKINRIETLRAVNQRDISVSELKSRLIQTVYDVEEAYWNLYSAIENLKVQESSLEQSRAILEKNREAVRIGSKSALEILTSEADVAAYEDALVSAKLSVEQGEERLKKILNLSSNSDRPDTDQSFVLADKPVIDKTEISFEEALRVAIAQRPEMAQSQNEIENASYDISFCKNQLLPQLDLRFSTWSPGQSGIKYIYQDDNYLTGIILGRIQGSRMDAFNEALKRTYKNWSVNLTLTLPLASVFSRAILARAKLQSEQATRRLESQKQSISYEVSGAIKELHNAELKMKSSAASRALQEKRLAAETQRYELGLGTIDWLLSYQRSLMSAKTSEARAVIDYKLAATRLEKAMGTLLKSKGIKFRDYDF